MRKQAKFKFEVLIPVIAAVLFFFCAINPSILPVKKMFFKTEISYLPGQ